MGDVIEQDFGKARRAFEEKLSRLLRLAEDQKAKLRNDPVEFYRVASEKIGEYQDLLRRAQDALRPEISGGYVPQDGPTERLELSVVNVDRREYERLKRCAEIIQGAE